MKNMDLLARKHTELHLAQLDNTIKIILIQVTKVREQRSFTNWLQMLELAFL